MNWRAWLTTLLRDPYRIAIVGCGPKGLYCLDALCEGFRDTPCRAVHITIFEHEPNPGAGLVYDPAQPDFLLMNFPSRFVDAWPGGPRRSERLSFCNWAATHASRFSNTEDYAPRREVGRYLADCFGLVWENRPAWITMQLHEEQVTRISRQNARWCISTGSRVESFDEVLVTTGHQDWQGTDTVPRVFPVTRCLREDLVPPGCAMSLRGCGLTAIDAVLALTLGRGGVFHEFDGMPSYRPSGREPSSIALRSRTGRPMLAKPEMGRIELPHRFEATCQALAARFGSLDGISNVERQIIAPLCQAADEILSARGGDARHWIDGWACLTPDHQQVVSLLRTSWQSATGRAALAVPDILSLLWRGTYPSLVNLVSHGGLDPDAWPRFHELAKEMERIAFGPPALNVGRLLALVETGLVTFGQIDPWDDYSDIDATLPAPAHHDPAGPLPELLSRGLVQRNPYGTLSVDRDGTALVDRHRVEGLSIVGRMVEVMVLGNDTLSRTLHDTPERWAQAAMSRVEQTAMASKRAIS